MQIKFPAAIVALLLFFAPNGATASDAASSASLTLRLGDLFDLRPGAPGYQPEAPRHFTRGPNLIIPDTGSWRAPAPTPTPTPIPPNPEIDAIPLPRLPMLIAAARDRTDVPQVAFTSQGRLPGQIPFGQTRLALDTRTRTLRAAYTLQPTTERGVPTGLPLILHHAPQTAEQFEIPAGHYQLTLSVWRMEAPQRNIQRRWRHQRFGAEEFYTFALDEKLENELLRQLGR
jgi:hypothetical protein